MSITENPFNQSYLTEGITTASELLAQYSFQPLEYVHSEVSRAGNVFLIGRKGVGKTMVLKLFDADLMSEIYRRGGVYEIPRHRLPTSTIGLYVNLASPLLRLRQFGGRQHEEDWWRAAFADFLNYVLLESFLKNLRTLSALPEWQRASGWTLGSIDENARIESGIVTALADEASFFEGLRTLRDLDDLVRAKLRAWVRYLNRDNGEEPRTFLSLGLPLFRITEMLRAVHPGIRVMILVDQYETLHSNRAIVDLRGVFNQAMHEASRGSTGVEFKIGCRPYAYGDLTLPAGSSSIETGREITIVDLDKLAASYFVDFVADLLAKRLRQAGVRSKGNRVGKEIARQYLPGFAIEDEVERYILNARADGRRHLHPFIEKWSEYGVSASTARAAIEHIPLTNCDALIGVLTGIALTQWLRRGGDRPPFKLDVCAGVRGGDPELIVMYGRGIREALEFRYREGTAASRRAGGRYRAADDLVSAYEQAALFRIASSYKNQRKYYTGFESLARVSSNVALVFIQIMKTAWDLSALREGASTEQAIPQEIQSEAVYAVSESWCSRVAYEYEYGVEQEIFVRNLGANFRRIQLEPGASIPTPNGFSVRATDLEASEGDPREDASSLILQLVGWGLLEEAEHQDKAPGRPRRRKFYLNRILCPYFGISEIHRGDPIYVRDVKTFVESIKGGGIPSEFTMILRGKVRAARRSVQPELF